VFFLNSAVVIAITSFLFKPYMILSLELVHKLLNQLNIIRNGGYAMRIHLNTLRKNSSEVHEFRFLYDMIMSLSWISLMLAPWAVLALLAQVSGIINLPMAAQVACVISIVGILPEILHKSERRY